MQPSYRIPEVGDIIEICGGVGIIALRDTYVWINWIVHPQGSGDFKHMFAHDERGYAPFPLDHKFNILEVLHAD